MQLHGNDMFNRQLIAINGDIMVVYDYSFNGSLYGFQWRTIAAINGEPRYPQ